MLYFPQLASGAVSQFPCRKRVRQRTVVNALADGSEVKLFDPGACKAEWEINLANLTGAEWSAMTALFDAAKGQLGTFVFLDPFGNLLSWSEDLGAAVWVKDSGQALTAGGADPLGGTGATRVVNSSGASANIAQTVPAPGWYRYCLSVWARSDTAARMTLFAGEAQQAFTLGTLWRRLEMGAHLAGQQGTTAFGITVPGGVTVEVFGFQAEAQVGASSYKATGAQSGVYTEAYFLSDVLALTSEAPGVFSCPVWIGARG